METSQPHHEARLEPRIKVWVELDGAYVFGSGISAILKAVEQEGSIKAAARLLGKSYRYVWSRIKDAEKTLGQPLVETQIGGHGLKRSELTSRAEQLILDFDELRERMRHVIEEEFASRFQACRKPLDDD